MGNTKIMYYFYNYRLRLEIKKIEDPNFILIKCSQKNTLAYENKRGMYSTVKC